MAYYVSCVRFVFSMPAEQQRGYCLPSLPLQWLKKISGPCFNTNRYSRPRSSPQQDQILCLLLTLKGFHREVRPSRRIKRATSLTSIKTHIRDTVIFHFRYTNIGTWDGKRGYTLNVQPFSPKISFKKPQR